MPIETDYVEFYRAIADELKATQNRMRNLIGSQHWLSDGEHKEVIVRRMLRSFLPESLHVGRGFVCYRHGPSTQIDVLITHKEKPTLFKDGDTVLVTPDCVRAVVEVKTQHDSPKEWRDTLDKLAGEVAAIRRSNDGQACWAGLFVFDEPPYPDPVEAGCRVLLDELAGAAGGEEARAVNYVAWGSDLFVLYWPSGRADCCGDRPAWHAYAFDRGIHARLAPAYFVSNLVWDVSPRMPDQMMYAWFPIASGSGKEEYRVGCAGLRAADAGQPEEGGTA